MDRIITAQELTRSYADVSKYCRECQQPVVVTVDGREDMIIMGTAAFERIAEDMAELTAGFSAAEDDFACGRFAPVEVTFAELHRMLDAAKAEGRLK